MHQLATEGGGFGPCGFGVPGANDNNDKSYVYDIDHRSDQCVAVTKVMDIAGIPVSLGISCPVGTGAAVTSVTGGDIGGFDMYGQYITETVAAAGTSVATYQALAFGPDDLLWANIFGLPYRHAADNAPADIVYTPPAGVDGRGKFTWGGTFPAEAKHDYTVDRVNMFGDVRDQFASGEAIADQTWSGTIDANGQIVITKAAIADSSDWVRFRFDDNQRKVTPNDGAGTITHNLDPWYLSTRKGLILGIHEAGQLIYGTTSNNTQVLVTLTGVEPGQTGVDPAPVPNPVKGPFMAFGIEFWVNEDTCMVGFDIDSDEHPDTWHTWAEIDANDEILDESKLAYKAQLEACGCPT